ncbi:MAG TPA: twin-arginine translocase TatA/TatE family subunit [Candidatus Limnocylindrales bacterium]|nr:twin-arginine translocase TatA/TatE family subunit [Candidatus Limnocylindrales bacterium]
MPIIGNIGPLELLLVLALALLILGPGKLPEVGAAFGRTIREFRKATTEVNDAVNPVAPSPTPAHPAPTAAAAPPVAGVAPATPPAASAAHAEQVDVPAGQSEASQTSTTGA